MLQDKNNFTNKIGNTIRMCMFVICGARENKYKQPKFVENSAQDSIYFKLTALIDEGKLDEAENIMYDSLNPRYMDDYYTMLCVYDYMNELDEEFLKQNGFSKEEIEDGVGEITKAYDSEGIYNNIL